MSNVVIASATEIVFDGCRFGLALSCEFEQPHILAIKFIVPVGGMPIRFDIGTYYRVVTVVVAEEKLTLSAMVFDVTVDSSVEEGRTDATVRMYCANKRFF